MEPNKPMEVTEKSRETYMPGQKAILNILRIGAWTVTFVAILYAMRS